MNNISAGQTAANLVGSPIQAVTGFYSAAKGTYTESIQKDGEDRVNFEPSKNNYLDSRSKEFFDFNIGKDNK